MLLSRLGTGSNSSLGTQVPGSRLQPSSLAQTVNTFWNQTITLDLVLAWVLGSGLWSSSVDQALSSTAVRPILLKNKKSIINPNI